MTEDLFWFVNQDYDEFIFEEVGDLISTGLIYLDVKDQQEKDLKLPSKYELSAYVSEIGVKMREILKK